jgi:hypothetical protein
MFRNVRFFGSFAAALFFFACAAGAQVAPYIADIVGEEGMERYGAGGEAEGDALRLIGSFKLFNPDTVPFYIWATFENGAKFKHTRHGGKYPAVRLVDMELRYKNGLGQVLVKEFPREGLDPRVARRLGWGFSGEQGRFGRKKERGAPLDANAAPRAGAVEVAFWPEDAQACYEMELWGALYAPDLRAAVYPGEYMENIKFELEAMPEASKGARRAFRRKK